MILGTHRLLRAPLLSPLLEGDLAVNPTISHAATISLLPHSDFHL
jgi:hypothetical protein